MRRGLSRVKEGPFLPVPLSSPSRDNCHTDRLPTVPVRLVYDSDLQRSLELWCCFLVFLCKKATQMTAATEDVGFLLNFFDSGRIWTRTSACKFTSNLKRSISCVWCGVCVFSSIFPAHYCKDNFSVFPWQHLHVLRMKSAFINHCILVFNPGSSSISSQLGGKERVRRPSSDSHDEEALLRWDVNVCST